MRCGQAAVVRPRPPRSVAARSTVKLPHTHSENRHPRGSPSAWMNSECRHVAHGRRRGSPPVRSARSAWANMGPRYGDRGMPTSGERPSSLGPKAERALAAAWILICARSRGGGRAWGRSSTSPRVRLAGRGSTFGRRSRPRDRRRTDGTAGDRSVARFRPWPDDYRRTDDRALGPMDPDPAGRWGRDDSVSGVPAVRPAARRRSTPTPGRRDRRSR
jgi:hypothetical protein